MKDFWAEGLQNQRKGKLRKVAIFVMILLVLIAISVLISVYFLNVEFRNWCDDNVLRKEIKEIESKVNELAQLGYKVYTRDVNSDIYKIIFDSNEHMLYEDFKQTIMKNVFESE